MAPRALRQLAPFHDAIEQVCGMVQARADDERSMAQRQNRDAGKVEKSAGTSSPPVGPRQGAVPLPAVKNQKHAQAIIGCQGWALEATEVDVLDAALPRSGPNVARLR